MDLRKPAKTLAILGVAFLLILPVITSLMESLLLSTYQIGNVTYTISPPYFWMVFILNYIFGITILVMGLTGESLSYLKGVFFLIFGILVTGVNFGHSAMIMGILLMLAGILVLIAYSDNRLDDSY